MDTCLYIKKPKGITSFKLCQSLRPVFKTRAIGHTGTLDPLASGVMVVLIGKACKLNQFLVGHDKTYIATVKLGLRTTSEDIEGEIIEERECQMPDFEKIETCLNSFLGDSYQTPPLTSAIKVNGQKLYEYQRNNEEVELKPRPIHISKIRLLKVYEDTFKFEVTVSSGTYIRALARDVLAKLGLIGVISDLERVMLGKVRLEDCDDLEDVLKGVYQSHSPYEVLSQEYETIEVEDPKMILDGKHYFIDAKEEEILLSHEKKALAVYRRLKDREYKCVRGLF